MKVSVLGCGRWGAFLAWYLDRCGFDTALWGRGGSPHLTRLRESRANEYLTLPESVALTDDLQGAASRAKIIVVSVDAQGLRDLLTKLADCDISGKPVVLCIKGLEQKTGKRLSVVAQETIGDASRVAVWLGPGHVQDFTAGTPGCMVIDSANPKLVQSLCDKFSSRLIRFYYGTDLIGNEIGAAAKNVVGIAAGMLDGLHMSSLKGALMARGTREVARLIAAEGGDERSVYGLCHLGDYEATLFSPYSHNRQYGELFIQGKTLDKLAEGVFTTQALTALSKRKGVDMPIVHAVHDMLSGARTPAECFDRLFMRSRKKEF
jgi:glycerol-3-phosphate dehydrogenase (NAD(P)+)